MLKLHNLDTLRAIAALIVVFFHLNGEAPGFLPLLSKFGWMGVDLFFVISGAVVAHSAASLQDRYGASWRREYALRRVARIYPLYLLTCLVFLSITSRFWQQDAAQIVGQIASHAVMLHAMHPATFQGLNHVTWSLAIEVQYYLLVALAITPIRRYPGWLILAGALIVSYVWNVYFRQHIQGDEATMHFFLSQLPGRIDEFAWGIVIWKFWRMRPAIQGVAKTLLPWLGLASLAAGATLLYAWCVGVSQLPGSMAHFGLAMHHALGDGGVRLMFGFACGLIVFGAINLPEPRLLTPVAWVGTVSYGVYLWHPMLIDLVARTGMRGVSYIVMTLMLTIAVSAWSWFYFERDFVERKRQPAVLANA